MKRIIAALILSLPLVAFSQQRAYKGSSLTVGLAYMELKDALNHGFVFRGPDANVDYGFESVDANHYFNYTLSIAGGGKAAASSWGFRWSIVPIRAHYSLPVLKKNDFLMYAGPSLVVNYNVQTYPDMHAGPIIWMTSYDVGLQLSGMFSIKGKQLELQLRNSVASASSRPVVERDPHFFSTKIGTNLSDMHSNMVVGSVNKYNSTEFKALLYLEGSKRTKSLSYTFQYNACFDAPDFKQLMHALNYTWYFNASQ